MDNKIQQPINQQLPTEQMPMQSPEPVKRSSKTMWYVLVVIVLVVLGGAGYLFMKKSHTNTAMMQQTSVMQHSTMQPKPTLPRSKPLGLITNVVTASFLDAQGNAVSPSSSFSTTKTIYLVVSLNNAKVGTKVEYVRYLNDKYLDNNALKVSKPNTANVSFIWSSKSGTTRLTGAYKVKVYANGLFEKETVYVVQ